MKYVGEVKSKKGQTYSIDKIVAVFDLLKTSDILGLIRGDLLLQFDQRQEFSLNRYEWQFSIKCPGNNSFWLGVGFRSCEGKKPYRCKIEFNPNKVAESAEFIKIFNYLVMNCPPGIDVQRWDLAIDIPVERCQAHLCKGNGVYEEYWLSNDNRTQYIGQRNQVGRCKLYNKQLESDLKEPLTRFEITLGGSDLLCMLVELKMPKVMWTDAQTALETNPEGFSETELYVFEKCLEEPNDLKRIGRYLRKKIECALVKRTHQLELDSDSFEKIVAQLNTYRQPLEMPAVTAVPVEWFNQPVSGVLVPQSY